MFLGSKCVRVSMVACAIVLVLVFTNQEDIVVARTALLSQQAAATQEWMRDETTTLTISGGVVPQQSNEEFVGVEPSEMHSPSSFSSLSPSSSASSSLTLLTVRNVFRAASLPPFARKKTQARDEKGSMGHSSRRSYASGEVNEALAAWLKRKLIKKKKNDVRLHEHRSGANSSSSSSSIAVIRVPLGDMNAVDLPRLIRALHEAETLLFKASDSAHHGDQHQRKPVIRGQGVLLCVASAAVATRTGSDDTNTAEWGQRQEGEQQHAAGLSSNILFSSSNLCWLPSGVTVESILARLATDVVSYDDAELEEIPDDEVVVAKRIMVGPSITRSEAAASCLISNQGGLLGSGVHAPFATNVPVPTPPLLITRDIVQFILNYFAQDVIEVFDDIVDHHHSTNDANDAAKTATSSSDEQNSSPSTRSSSRNTHHDDSPPMIAIRRSPIAAACGIPMRIRGLSPQQYPFPLPPIPLHHCIGLFMSGRDVHRVTFADWNPISASIPLHAQQDDINNNNSTKQSENDEKLHTQRLNRLAKRSATSMRVEEQMPFIWLTGDASGKKTQAHDGGLPWWDETSGAVSYVHTHTVDITPPSRSEAVSPTSESDGVIAAVYVPTRIDQFGMRDIVRCYYRSLERPVRDRLALHFLLGARATMDSRFVFRGRGDVRAEDTYIADSSGLSVWHRLVLENRSHDFERRSTSVARDSGDLLLLDVIDLDRAP
ncbi:GPI-anchored surface protein, putative, partial [Bodo saltans]